MKPAGDAEAKPGRGSFVGEGDGTMLQRDEKDAGKGECGVCEEIEFDSAEKWDEEEE